jgi:hypothetical protein
MQLLLREGNISATFFRRFVYANNSSEINMFVVVFAVNFKFQVPIL